jgi:hypothetical protein
MTIDKLKTEWTGLLYAYLFYTGGCISIIFKNYSINKYGFNAQEVKAIIFGVVLLFIAAVSFINFYKSFKKLLSNINYDNQMKIRKLYVLCAVYCIYLFVIFIPVTFYLKLFIRITFFIFVGYIIIYIVLLNSEIKKIILKYNQHTKD